MEPSGAVLDMATPKKRPVGRPKAAKPLKTVVALKDDEAFEAWLHRAAEFARQPSRANFVRIALEDWAKHEGFEMPPKRRGKG